MLNGTAVHRSGQPRTHLLHDLQTPREKSALCPRSPS